jgi:hypothetical protein
LSSIATSLDGAPENTTRLSRTTVPVEVESTVTPINGVAIRSSGVDPEGGARPHRWEPHPSGRDGVDAETFARQVALVVAGPRR